MLSCLIIGLIVVTIIYERLNDLLEEHVFNKGIKKLLMQKMTKELSILGFVSFTATVGLQFVHLSEAPHQVGWMGCGGVQRLLLLIERPRADEARRSAHPVLFGVLCPLDPWTHPLGCSSSSTLTC
jgi:hypothetical protein